MEMGTGGPVPPPPPGGGQYGSGQQQPYGQPQQQQYPQQQQQYGGGGQQPAGQRATEVMQTVQRAAHTPETKPFYLTSEFLVWLLTVIGVLIAGAVISDSDAGDVLKANTVWTLITILSFAYIISRGISKAGAKYGSRDNGGGGNF